MNQLRRWDPFELGGADPALRRWVERVFGDRDELGFGEGSFSVDVYEKDDQIVVKASLPGVARDDIQVDVTEGVLRIRAEKKAERDVREGDYLRHESRYGHVSRSIRLPPNVDTSNAEATYQDGVLRLSFPITEETSRSHRIEVREGAQQRRITEQPRAQEGQQQQKAQPPKAGQGS